MAAKKNKPAAKKAGASGKSKSAGSKKASGKKPAGRGSKPAGSKSKSGGKAKAAAPTKKSARPATVKKKAAPAKASASKKAGSNKASKLSKKPLQAKKPLRAAKKTPPKKLGPSKAEVAKQREKARLAQEKARALKEKERERLAREKEKAVALKEKERERLVKEKEKERLLKEKEKDRLKKDQERLRKEKDKERERERLLKEKEKERLKKEQERLRKEKEKEKERIRKEKERERLEIQRKRDEERIRKEKEREAYRRAREAERERVRAEKEAARRALEGRIARQARQQARIAGSSRGGSARVYRPDAIPSQAGTTRDGVSSHRAPTRLAPPRLPQRPAVPPSVGKPRPPEALDERWALIQKRLAEMPERFQREYAESFDMSWIHHDSALEGVVYTFQELKTAIDKNIVIVPDSSLQPVCEEIRRHKQAIDWVRELGRESTPLTADVLKKLYILLHPEEGDLKSVKYRKEIPQHRLYFHEYAPPDKIAVRIRQAFEWLHGPEPDKLKDPVRVAARLHYDLLRTFPFPEDSGKVARMLMNILLLRANLPPVIVHSTERQRYYDALRGSLPVIVAMVNDSVKNALASIEKVLDEEEDKASSPPPSSSN